MAAAAIIWAAVRIFSSGSSDIPAEAWIGQEPVFDFQTADVVEAMAYEASNPGGRKASPARSRAIKKDPIRNVLHAIMTGGYDSREQVASGRFLKKFEEKQWLVEDIEVDSVRATRRRPKWISLEATYRKHGDSENTKRSARLRFVKDKDEAWKLEDVRLGREEK